MKIRIATISIIALAGAVACGNFLPIEGEWRITDETVVSDSCGFTDDEDTGEADEPTFALAYNEDDDTFTVTIEEEDADDHVLDCTLDGMTYACTGDNSVAEDEVDLTLTFDWTIDGEFASDGEMSGTQSVELSCTGADCSLLDGSDIELPCTMVVDFVATAVNLPD